jgi:hypothetical protein
VAREASIVGVHAHRQGSYRPNQIIDDTVRGREEDEEVEKEEKKGRRSGVEGIYQSMIRKAESAGWPLRLP